MPFPRTEPQFLSQAFSGYFKFRLNVFLNLLRQGHWVRSKRISDYFSSHAIRKVHLGASQRMEGFLNSQVLGEVPIDITRRMPFPDGSVDLIFLSHLIEHIHLNEGIEFLKECYRVLKKGGVNIVATPSLDKYCDILYGNVEVKKDLLRKRYEAELGDGFYTPCQQVNLSMRAFGHRFLYDRFYMRKISEVIGYAGFHDGHVEDIPDERVKQYLDIHKSLRWHVETGIYIFEK